MGKTNDPVIEQFVGDLKKHFRIEKVILFGSRARKDHLLDSDYDVIIVSPDFEGMNFVSRISLMYEYWSSCLNLEALCYTPHEFNRKKEQISIVKVAVEEGIEIAA